VGCWCGCLYGARCRQLYDLHINSMTYMVFFLFQIISFKKYFYVSLSNIFYCFFSGGPLVVGPGQLPSLPSLKSGPDYDCLCSLLVWNLCPDGNMHGIIYRHNGRTGLGWIDGKKSLVFRRGKSGNPSLLPKFGDRLHLCFTDRIASSATCRVKTCSCSASCALDF